MKLHSVLGMAILAGAVVLGTAEVSEAARGGRGGGGRGGSGGGRGYGGGYRGGYYGGGWGYGGWGLGIGVYPYGYYGSGYGYSPYYYGDNYYAQPAGAYQSNYPPSTVISDNDAAPSASIAQVTVRVPANAEVWFNGRKMSSTGTVRTFETPPLGNGEYSYQTRVRWMQNGREVSQTKEITVSPGTRINVSFPTNNVTQ